MPDASDVTVHWTEYVNAFSTFAVAFLAIVAIIIQKTKAAAHRRAVDARISAQAFALRRTLASWVDRDWGMGMNLLATAQYLSGHFDATEKRVEDMVSSAPDASEDLRRTVRRVYVLFYSATQFLNEGALHASDSTLAANTPYEVWDGLDKAKELLEECVGVLGAAVDKDLRKVGATSV